MLEKLFDQNKKHLKKIKPIVEKINSFETKIEKLTGGQIKQKTKDWKAEFSKLDEKEQEKLLEKILPEVYAVARESAKRSVDMRPFDVQLVAAVVLHWGQIAEQKTGEGENFNCCFTFVSKLAYWERWASCYTK